MPMAHLQYRINAKCHCTVGQVIKFYSKGNGHSSSVFTVYVYDLDVSQLNGLFDED
jgi:hypothetical protein